MHKSIIPAGLFVCVSGALFGAAKPANPTLPGPVQPATTPRYFEANRGQWADAEAYRAYGYGYAVSLRKNGLVLDVANPQDARQAGRLRPPANPLPRPSAPREVSLRFEGSNSSAQLTGLAPLDASGAWFQGEPSQWRSGIPLYERVRAAQIYPGIDVTYYGRDGQLEYDLDVAAGARINALILDLDGADQTAIDKNGDLTIAANGQTIVLRKPLAWQPDGQGRKAVEVSYTLLPSANHGGRRIGLHLTRYDATRPLTIDPVLTFATYLASSTSALPDYYIIDLAIDNANNIYVLSTDNDSESMTVQKLTSAGALVYTATFSSTSSGHQYPASIRVNASGQAYVAASATAGYPTTATAYQQTYPNHSYGNQTDGAVSVISANGSSLVYSTYFGGIANGSYGPDSAFGVAVDSSGNAYLTGQAEGDTFPVTPGAYQTSYLGANSAAFVAKLNPSAAGTASLVYSTLLGGPYTTINNVAVDTLGNAYIAVFSENCNVAITQGAFAYAGIETSSECGYISAINPTGTALDYSAYIGPGEPIGIAVDGSGNVYTAGGYIQAEDFPTTPGAYQLSYPDGFALELNASGGMIYSTFLSGPSGGTRPNHVYPSYVALAPGCASACTAYIAGETEAADFPLISALNGPPPIVGNGYWEPFLVELNGTGSAALTSGYLSGLKSSLSQAAPLIAILPTVAVDSLGNTWLAGTLTGYVTSDFPVTTSTAPGPNGSWLAEVSPANAGNVIAMPNSVAFGNAIPVGLNSTLYNGAPTTIALRNMGSAAVTYSVNVSPSVFTESDSCNGQIAASSYCTATIVFTPATDAPATGTLTVTSSGLNGSLTVPLTGQGADAGYIQSSTAALNFGNQTINTSSAPQTVTLTNVGDETVNSENYIYLYQNAGFSEVNNCTSALPPGNSCQVQVTFSPSALQVGSQTTLMEIGPGNATCSNGCYVNLTGTGVLPSTAGGTQSFALSATTLNFGSQPIGTTSPGQTTDYITNTGSLPLALEPPTITLTSSQGSAADFQITDANTSVLNLLPQAYTPAYVEFTPSAAATETGTITYAVEGSSTPVTINLVGQGLANTQVLEFQPGNAVFPDQPVGVASNPQTIYVMNTGNTPFLVDRVIASGDFAIYSTTCAASTLAAASAPGESPGYCWATVTFTPSQTGARAGTLTIYDAVTGSPQTIPLVGNGIAAAGAVTVDATQFDFGTLVKGTSSPVQYVTLTNSGDINVNLTSVATTGDYAITYNDCSNLPYAIPPGSSYCQIGVTFTPTVSTTPDNGTLTLTTSAGTQVVTLTGGGEASTLAAGLSPTSINYGSYQVGQTTFGVPVYVRNSGTATLKFTAAATVTGNYQLNDDCDTAGLTTLAAGQDCYIFVTFAPTATGTRAGTLTVKTNAGTLTASLTGIGVSASSYVSYFYPQAASFDQQAVNSISAPMTIDFDDYANSSAGFQGASITAGSANFQLASGGNALNSCTAANSPPTCQVNVVYSPSAAGYETGTLTVTTSAGTYSVGLSGYAPPVSDTGYLSPSALDFPSQVVTTTSAVQQITLYNTGAASFTVGTTGGTNVGPSAEFQLNSDSCSGQTIAPTDSETASGGSCIVTVQFAPSGSGARTGTLSIPVTYSDGTTGTFTASLTGTGVAQDNEAVVFPTLVTFPDTVVGTVNSNWEQTVILTNPGNLPFSVGKLTGTDTIIGTTKTGGGEFTAAAPYGTDSCSNQVVAAGNSCGLNVVFQPGTVGARAGTITFPVTYANATTPVMLTASLSGNGIAQNPSLVVSPAGIQFDSVTVNAGVADNWQKVTATNDGNVSITVSKSTLPTGFSFANDGCTGTTVLPGNSCIDYVYFNPTTAGAFSGTLSLTDNAAGSPQTVLLSGTSLAASSELEFSQTTVSFGNQLVKTTSNSITIYLINSGSKNLTVKTLTLGGTNPGNFGESDGCAGTTLAANSTCTINLTFTPSTTGSRTATLTESDSGTGGPRTINISGSGINASTAITFFPAALSFNSLPAGESGPQQFFSVTNIGNNPVMITSDVSTDPTDFQIVQDTCAGNTLSTGVSCLIDVLFTPASAGNLSASINVTDTATGSPQQLPLSGHGTTALTSSTTLTANPSSAALGSLFTLVATVKDQNSNPVTNGSVTFYDGTTLLGAAQVVTNTAGGGVIGTATLKTILVPLGANSITAKYVGADATSTSAPASVTITGLYPTTTTFTSSGSAGDYTFTGTVIGAGPVVTTGSVAFTDTTTGLIPGTADINAASLAQTFVAAPPDNGLSEPMAVAVADLNGDGIPDLVTGSESGITVQLGNGDGTFQAPVIVTSAATSATGYFGFAAGVNIAFGDFNGDGKTDIASVECTNSVDSCSVGVLLGNGDGTFQKEHYFDQGPIISGIAVGDFNGDGILDIVVTNYSYSTVDLLTGNGDGTFQQPVSTLVSEAPTSVAAGDVNGDGKPDLVVTSLDYLTAQVLLGNGNGTFQAAQSWSTNTGPGNSPSNLALADLRGTGKLDIVVIGSTNSVVVLLNNGNGTYGSATAVYSPASPSVLTYLAVADVNGDGKPDLVVTDSGRVEVSVLLGNGDGTFQSPNSWPTGAGGAGVAVSDLNHDGRPDIAVANFGGTTATILLNQVSQTASLTGAIVPGTGTHSVSAAYSGDTKFSPSTSSALPLAASLVTPTMQLAGEPSTSVMWGQSLSVRVTLTGPLSFVPTPTGSVSYSIDGGTAQPATLASGAVTIPISQLSVGSHSIAVSYGGDQYYTTLAAQSLALTVTKANQTITFNALPNVTYGVAPITLSGSSTSGLAIMFTVGAGPASITNGIMTITGAGSVKVDANQSGNTDYNAAPQVTRTFTVAQAPLTITVNSASKVYGAALPALSGTVSGLVNGDTVTVTYSTTATAASSVGTYPITATISGTAAPNYSLTVNAGTLTITPATLKVTASNATRAYGAANPVFTDTITGFVNGDTISVVSGAASLTTTATTTSAVGSYPITAALGTLSTTNYTFTFMNGTLSVTQATPTITWATPAAISYGAALSPTQLDATANTAGTFVYSPVAGTVLSAGSQTLSVTFTPNNTTDYKTATASVTLTVKKATPGIDWPTPAAITYGTAISSTQLDATSPVAGTFVYTPAAGAVLKAPSHPLSVTFTPTDTTDYSTATDSITLTINQATPSITWATPAPITYGTALSATQLDATSTVAGTFAYSPISGTVLGAGAQTLTATFTPADTTDYTTARATVTLTVSQVTPTVTWANPAAITYGTALTSAQLDATASVPGAFVYTPAAGTVLAPGTQSLSVTFAPTDSTDYKSVTTSASLVVNKATPVITWANPPAITYGKAISSTQLDATASEAGTFAYTPAAGTVLSAGAQTLCTTFTPTNTTDYVSVTTCVTLTVNQAKPTITWATPTPIIYGTALSATQLDATASVSGSIAYSPAAGKVLDAGTQTLNATFTPSDTIDYMTVTASVSLTVNKAAATITWATPAAITYGTALTSAQLDATASVAGTFAYTPGTGAVLKAPSHSLSVTFTPTDTTDYKTATATVTLTINQATPAINWATPAPITYGTTLSATQLDARSPVAGAFAYTPAAGTELAPGPQTLSTTFTPTDATDYTTATGSVTLTVNKAIPAITWGTPTAISYGAALSATQLDATASVAGTFAYSPAKGTVLGAGAQSLSVTFTPTNTTDYATTTASVTLTVNKATLTVTAKNASRPYAAANPAFTDTITGFVHGDTISVVNGAASLTTTATATSAAGSYPITAALGTLSAANYTFTFVNATLTVTKATPLITWPTPAPITYGNALSATQLDATANAAGTFVYAPAVGAVLKAPSHTISVTFTPTDTTDYTTATASVTLIINQATPAITWATPAPIVFGTALTVKQLDATSPVAGAFTYNPAKGKVPAVGTDTLSVSFAPTDFTDYTPAMDSVMLTVEPNPAATPVISPAAGTYTTPQTVTINDGTSGASIYYTTNGTAPTTSSTLYTPGQGIPVSATTQIEAIAINLGTYYTQSETATATYTLNLPPAGVPTISPASGTYSSAQTVSITGGPTGGTIYYTLDGTYPGLPGKSCTSCYERNWNERSLEWHEGRSIHRSRS